MNLRIKKSYRKKALELHPDRNYGDVEETTKQFAEVQSAYEVLSDPQERTWYDAHRDSILRGEDDITGDHYEHNVRVTTAEEILSIFRRFNSRVDFTDAPTGFYGSLRDTFETIAEEEEAACEWEGLEPIEYPSFGHADDDYEAVVKPFYTMWNGFATQKSFSWKDLHRYSEAPDRRVRRLIEKENKRLRNEGIRGFNDAVRSLVAFVRKRDPRFKANQQTEAERQKVLRDAANAQAARAKAAQQAKLADVGTVPQWMKSAEPQEDGVSDDEAETIPKEEYECIVCNKNFKSEKQYDAHEKSKKHSKAVQQIRRQMQKEDKGLSLGESITGATTSPTPKEVAVTSEDSPEQPRGESSDDSAELVDGPNTSDHNREPQAETQFSESEDAEPSASGNPASTSDSTSDDEYTSREKVQERILGQDTSADADPKDEMDGLSERLASGTLAGESGGVDHRSRLGKAKEKRARKAAQQTASSSGAGTDFKCAACQAGFPSKTRLFNHIKDVGHAQPVPKPTKGGKGKNR